MSKEIKKYNSDFKFKVVMKYLSENYTIYQICSEYDIAKSTLHKWVKQFKASGNDIFSDSKLSKEEKLSKKEQKKKDKEIDKLYKKIGQLRNLWFSYLILSIFSFFRKNFYNLDKDC